MEILNQELINIVKNAKCLNPIKNFLNGHLAEMGMLHIVGSIKDDCDNQKF
jgi:hypothetical protein